MLFRVFITFLVFFPAFSHAEKPSADAASSAKIVRHSPKKDCERKTVANLNINLSRSAETFAELSQYFEETRDSISNKAKRMGITDIKIQNSNFNINSNYNRYQHKPKSSYTLNGSIRYETLIVDKAIDLAEQLSKEEYNITYSENMRQGYCPYR